MVESSNRFRGAHFDPMAKQLFGTDGIRGIPGQYPLDDATLDRVGLALGRWARSARASRQPIGARVLIGRDTRESGPHIAERIARLHDLRNLMLDAARF